MNAESLSRFWPLIYSLVREFWAITEPCIEDAAVKNDIPIELYYYSELGLKYFSVEDFQKRDPFTNPEQFEKAFARFDVKGWIIPLPDDRYQVSRKAQEAVERIVRAGDMRLAGFDLMPGLELKRLVTYLKQLYNLEFRTGGAQLGLAFLEHLQQTAKEHQWPLEFDLETLLVNAEYELRLLREAFPVLLESARSFASQLTDANTIEAEMQSISSQFSEAVHKNVAYYSQ